MFGKLSEGFGKAFRKLGGQSAITEKNVGEAMDEVRTALLEADVHYDVVNEFCEQVTADALGTEVIQSLKPGEQMVGIVHRRLVDFLGGVMFGGAISPAERQAAIDFLESDDAGLADPNYNNTRIRQTVGYMLGYAQFQEQ